MKEKEKEKEREKERKREWKRKRKRKRKKMEVLVFPNHSLTMSPCGVISQITEKVNRSSYGFKLKKSKMWICFE
jgi:hypothetical protein